MFVNLKAAEYNYGMWNSMATLNGVEFGIVNKNTTVIHDNNVIDIPGSDTVVNDDAGYSTAPMSVTGHAKNESEFDDFKGEFYSGGELTLIADPDSGKQYTLYASGNVTELDGDDTYPLTDILFQCTFFMKYPYLESVLDVTRTKTITTNNQEWSSDDDGNPLKTDGNVDAAPDIQITGGAPASSINRTYGFTDGDTDATEYTTSNTSYVLRKTFTFTALPGIAYMVDYIAAQLKIDIGTELAYVKATIETASLYSGVETDMCEFTQPAGYATKSCSPDLIAGINEDVIIRWYQKSAVGFRTAYLKDIDVDLVYYRKDICLEPEIYNTSDTTTKSSVGNEILEDEIHTINTDGTGTVTYADDFTTNKYLDANWDMSGITYVGIDEEIDIADNGFLIYKIDTKYPIVVIPTLTTFINIFSGTPTIQISSDGTTWHDIDTAIVDIVDTEYPLDSIGNLSLLGLSAFYFRFDCVKAAAATATIRYFELDINIHTIYAKNPKITRGSSASTFRCDQDAASGLNCEILLEYKNTWWA